MQRIYRPLSAAILAFTGITTPAIAEVTIEAGATVVGQQTSQQNQQINKDVTGSADLVIDADLGPGSLHIYIEGSSTSDVSAASIIDGANADAGTAVNSSGRGRLQFSEIAYGLELGRLKLSVGVLDLAAFADATSVANDEGEQFLADALVNNPTIAFPDYTPSIILNEGDGEGVGGTLLLANGYGLGDNSSASYRDLFSFGRDRSSGLKKGLFALAELRIPTETGLTMGGWLRSSELPRHLGGANKSRAFGLYGCADGAFDELTRWSARAGWNNAKATDEVVSHVSFAIEHSYTEDHVIALGTAINGLSSDFKRTYANAANPFMAEIYYRWQINEFIGISPDIQYWHNTNGLSRATAGMAGGNAWVYGLRLQIGASHRMME